jgi:hypothetical protein
MSNNPGLCLEYTWHTEMLAVCPAAESRFGCSSTWIFGLHVCFIYDLPGYIIDVLRCICHVLESRLIINTSEIYSNQGCSTSFSTFQYIYLAHWHAVEFISIHQWCMHMHFWYIIIAQILYFFYILIRPVHRSKHLQKSFKSQTVLEHVDWGSNTFIIHPWCMSNTSQIQCECSHNTYGLQCPIYPTTSTTHHWFMVNTTIIQKKHFNATIYWAFPHYRFFIVWAPHCSPVHLPAAPHRSPPTRTRREFASSLKFSLSCYHHLIVLLFTDVLSSSVSEAGPSNRPDRVYSICQYRPLAGSLLTPCLPPPS